jgi:hypothetical protein
MLNADQRADGLKIDVMAVEQGLMAVVRGPDERTADMLALVARLAGEPVAFDLADPSARAPSANSVIRRAMDAVFDERPVVIEPALDAAAADVGVARHWPAGDGPGSVEVAVVGGAALTDTLVAADAALGILSARSQPIPAEISPPPAPKATHVLTIHDEDANLAQGRDAVAVGVLIRNGDTLSGQRVIALASTLLRLRLADSAAHDADADAKPGVQFAPRGLRPGAGLITITASCPRGEGARVAPRLEAAIRDLAANPAGQDEIERARWAYIDGARKRLDDATYWAGVLAACSTRGYTPDELAAVESDLEAITSAQVSDVLQRALAERPPVTIHVRPPRAESGRPAERLGQP